MSDKYEEALENINNQMNDFSSNHAGIILDEDLHREEIETIREALTKVSKQEAAIRDLRRSAQAVIDRWDTPKWKDVEPTGKFINDLRHALEKHKATIEEIGDEVD